MKKQLFSFLGGIPADRLLELEKNLRGFAAAVNTDALMKAAGEKALTVIPADDAIMLFYSPSQEAFFLRMTCQPEGAFASPCLWRPGEFGPEIKRLLPPTPESFLLANLTEKDPLQGVFTQPPLRSFLACPLYAGADYWGVFFWASKAYEGFAQEDQIIAVLFAAYLSSYWLALSSKSKGEKAMREAKKTVESVSERLQELETKKGGWERERERLIEEHRRMAKTLEESTALATKELVEAYSRLEEESRSQTKKQLHAMVRREVEKAVRAFFNLDLILELMLDFCLEELKAQTGSVMLLDPETGTLRIKAAQGLKKEIVEQTQIPLGKAIAGFVALEGQPLLITDIENEPRFAKISGHRYNTHSLLSVPIKSHERVLGVININNKRSGEVFIQEDLDVLMTLAGQAALVIENASLYEKKERGLEIKNLYEVYLSKAILNKIAQEAHTTELAASSYGVVLLYIDLRSTDRYEARKGPTFPEVTRELLRIIHHYQGRVVKGLGEGFLALFGEPLAQADDALRALKTAKEILAAKAGKAEFLEGREVGLGLHSGQISRQRLLIDGQEEETLLGEAVKVAALLGQKAPKNYLYMTRDFYEKVHSHPESAAMALKSISVEGVSTNVYAAPPIT